MIRVFLFTTVLASFFSFDAGGQDRWRLGFVVMASGDTIQAEIPEWAPATTTSLTYRLNSSSPLVTPSAFEVHMYGWNHGRTFESISETPLFTEKRFYEVIVRGKADLLLINRQLLARMNDLSCYELIGNTRIPGADGKLDTTEIQPFRSKLSLLFNDCLTVLHKIEKSRLDDNSIAELFEEYNGCFEAPKKKSSVISVGIFGGWNSQKYFFSGQGNFLVNAEPTSSSGAWGGFVDFSIGKKSSVAFDVTLFSSRLDFESDRPELNEHNIIAMQASNMHVNLFFKFSLRDAGIIPYLFVGPSAAFTSGENSSRKRILTPAQGVPTETQYNNFIRTEFLIGLGGGAGVKYKNASKITPYVETRISTVSGTTRLETDFGSNRTFDASRNGLVIIAGIAYKFD